MVLKLILKFWKKALYLLITGSTSIFIAACYGVPMAIGNLGTWIIKVKDSENKPIQGLQVTVLQFEGTSDLPDTLGTQQTDSLGSTTFALTAYNQAVTHRHQAVIHDIDSTNNGGHFADTTIAKTDSTISTITLTPRQ